MSIVAIQTKFYWVIIVLVIIGIIILLKPTEYSWGYYWQAKLFSPGEISDKHLYHEGEKVLCQDCHRPGQALTNTDCSQCHSPNWFQENLPFLAGSHQIFAQKDRCLRCHGEHLGSDKPLTLVTLTPEEHQKLPHTFGKCVACHRQRGQQSHPSLLNTECVECHQNYSWSSEFNHKKYLSRAKSPREMLSLCQNCHKPNHHVNLSNPNSPASCIFCHEYWGKLRKQKELPFPEELFSKVKVDPKKFILN